jgi:hypothetical protein
MLQEEEEMRGKMEKKKGGACFDDRKSFSKARPTT